MRGIIQAVLALSGLGLAFGVLLAWVSKKFHVEVDPRVAQITDLLPGVNCGACGFAGCSTLAEALVCKQADLSSCAICDAESRKNIAKILGLSSDELKIKKTPLAIVACGGGTRAGDKFQYQGFKDCRIAASTMAGQKLCQYSCLGQGTCVDACKFNAIEMGDDGLPHVSAKRCVGCKKCMQACPRNIIYMLDRNKKVYIKCRSHDKGPQVVKICKVGCIACTKCVKECPADAIKMIHNLATIDHVKCINCMKCVKVCPTKAIAVV